MHSQVMKSAVLAVAFAASMPVLLAAQGSSKSSGNASSDASLSKWDIFAGYSYIAPKGTIQTPLPNDAGTLTDVPISYTGITPGGIASVARYFNKNLGVEIVGDAHSEDESAVNDIWVSSKDDMSGVSGGLIYRFPTAYVTPFIHALVGAEQVGGPHWQVDTWGPSFTLGGGLDYATPLFHRRLAIRLFQVDYQYAHVDFGNVVNGGTASINAIRLSGGVVFKAGSLGAPPPVTLSAVASPASIFPCDPVTVAATAGNLNPKLHTVYSWAGDGVTGNGPAAAVATCTLAPGTYTVKAGVKEGKAGKEGLKPWESAEASATFTVKPFDPPNLSCSASPATVNPGETSTISASGVSPQNRPLTYTYSATAGTINGFGASATFNSTGAPSGAVTVTCNVADDKGGTASGSATVTVAAPYVAPVESPEVKQLETRLALHSVFFPTNLPRTENPDGGLVASQEGTLTALATDFKRYLELKPDAHLTLIGHADARGSVEYNQALSERRVGRTKSYLVEKGVPEASIETRGLGKEQDLTEDQVKELVEQNPDLSAAERKKVLRELGVIVWAQNRRVDIVLSTTGQQSVRLYPFNAADSLTLLDKKTPMGKAPAHGKSQAAKKAAPASNKKDK